MIDYKRRAELREKLRNSLREGRIKMVPVEFPPTPEDFGPHQLEYPSFCKNPLHEDSWGEDSCMACWVEAFNSSQEALSNDSQELKRWKDYFLSANPLPEDCPACQIAPCFFHRVKPTPI